MAGECVSMAVAICTHNNAGLLEKTLASLARQNTQTWLHWSLLVVDNASTDRTADVVYAAIASGQVPRLRYVFEPEQGLVPARLRAVQETSAEWIAFVDDDCLLDEGWLANAGAFIQVHPDCGAFGGIVRLEHEVEPPDWVARYGYSFAEQEHGEGDVQREWLVGAGLVLNREALEQSGWLRKQYLSDRKGELLLSGGDMEMVLRIRAAGYSLRYTPGCVIHHQIQAKRATLAYMKKINHGLGASQTWCDLLVFRGSYQKFVAVTLAKVIRAWLKAAKQVLRIALRNRQIADLGINASFARGRMAGLKQVMSTEPAARSEMLGCARPRIARVALLHWGDVIEDFLSEIHVTLDGFRDRMTGGWMFGFVEAMRSAGIETTLVCVSESVENVKSWKHGPTGADICVLPASPLYRRLRGLAQTARKGVAARIAAKLLRNALPYLATPVRLLRTELRIRNCQAVLCQEYEHARFDLSVIAGAMAGIPVFATFQGGDTRFTSFERLFRRLAIKRSAGLIIGSSRERERVRSFYRTPLRKIAAICNPLDLKIWYPENRASARRALGLPEEGVLLIWHGRVDLWRKGLDFLIDAWEEIARRRPGAFHLVLVGDGPDSAKLRGRIASGNVQRVIWRNEYVLDRSMMRQYLSAANIYAFPSRHEGFPVAPLEAMACGLPVVAVDCVGVRDILADASAGGIVVPSGDAEAFVESVVRLVDDEDLRCRMGERARRHVEEHFGLNVVGGKLRSFLELRDLSAEGARR